MILEKTIRIPRSLSVKAASILKGFLNKNPADRLGCNRESGFMEIMTHPFFKTIEWEGVSLQHGVKSFGTIHLRRQHFLGGRGQKLAKLPTDNRKKLLTGGG